MPRLLLIDANATDSAQFIAMLAEDGYLVEQVATLAEGIEQTKRRAFDVLLLDLNLPDSQGIATYLAAREQLQTMPIVILTELTDDSTVSVAYRLGAQDFLIKSTVTPQWLVHSIKHAMFRGRLLEGREVPSAVPDEHASELRSLWLQETIDNVVVLRLLSKRLLDAGAILTIEQRLTSLVERGNYHLVVSMQDVEYISNAALGVLIGAQKRIRSKNGTLHLADVRKSVRKQLGSRQFHRLFQIYDNVGSAIASIAAAS
ncbi:MAG TPA: response regulator [Pirellulaceae bacterium]|nr:response regulator [Pirellulaceae bacterium]